MQHLQVRLRALGVATYAISGSPLHADRALARHDRIRFPIIQDRTFAIGRDYGVYGGQRMPMDAHAIIVVNAQGRIILVAEPTDMHVPRATIWRAAQHAAGR